ncbi:MAG: M14 family metallocarboxypeptidase [Oscillospiraceae bacterium]|nr:M14 family metallocarboxypeptidase [Oscillospiraceae bacterium]
MKKFFKQKPNQNVREKLYEVFKGFTGRIVLGKSHCGRPIDAFILGNQNDELTVMAGGFHGSEWLTILILIKFLNDLLKEGSESATCIIPCVNPDGTEIAISGANSSGKYKDLVEKISPNKTECWQANARGVDINHNFDANWENLRKMEIENNITGPAATRFGGKSPESELETKAICDFCRKFNVKKVFAFHSQGEVIYWNYGNKTPHESENLAKKLSDASGYELDFPEGLAVGGGFKDWFIEKFQRPGFTIEIGKGKNPLPLDSAEKIYNKIKKMLWHCID